MNYELLKQRMDKFFEETTPANLISKFEKLGYSFIDEKLKYSQTQQFEKVEVLDTKDLKYNWFESLFKHNKNKKQNLDKIEVFLCKIAL